MTGNLNGIKKIFQILDQKKLDAILVTCPYNRRYISGFAGDMGYLYISGKQRVLMTDSRYTTWAKNESRGVQVFEVTSNMPYEKKVNELLLQDHAKTIGFEDTKMLYADVESFRNKVKTADFVPLDDALDSLRRIKSEEELECLRQAQAIADAAFTKVLTKLHAGMTELEAALELENEMRRSGAEGLSFETIVASGIHSSMPHVTPTKKQLAQGDFVTMDFGCTYKGYCSDMTRTIVMGKASEKQRDIYQTVWEAQQKALEVIRAGLSGKEVDQAARDIIKEAGYGDYFGHGLGHGVGLYIHEEPRLSPKDDTILEENMVETVEPGIYIPGFGGVRIEDMVIVKKNGCENLTHSDKRLIEI